MKRSDKSLGQIGYEATPDGGQQNWGPWEKAPDIVRSIHERMAAAIEKEVKRRTFTRLMERRLLK